MIEPETGTERKAEARAAEAAAIRRRWVTLGEILAVLAVVISGATLWLNWSERSDSEAEKAAESRSAQVRAATLTLVAEAAGSGKRLDVRPAAEDQVIQGQTIRFPSSLGVDPVETTGKPRIEADWFDSKLQKAREKAKLPDDSRGDERLPMLIETRFVVDGDTHRDSAIYDVGYTIKGALISGHDVTLRGLSLVKRVEGAGGTAALDARWKGMMPTAKAD